MSVGAKALLLGILLSSTAAFADDTPLTIGSQMPPVAGFYLGPVVGANLLSFEWKGGTPFYPVASFQPSVRAGVFLPNFAIDGVLGFSSGIGTGGGSGTGTALTLGGEIMPYLWSSGPVRLYALGGLNTGFQVLSGGGSTETNGLFGFSLGMGAQVFAAQRFAIGFETGFRTQLLLGDASQGQSTGLFLAMTGIWMPNLTPSSSSTTSSSSNTSTAAAGPEDKDKPHRDCVVYVADGWFEPTQGVWQDDPTFEDHSQKQLTRVEGDGVAYRAELKMVEGRDTVLIGVHHYRRAGAMTTVDSRDDIVLKGLSNCTVPKPVKMKFSLREGLASRDIFTSAPAGEVPLAGEPAAKFSPWEIRIPARDGLPAQPFQFQNALPYELKAELVEAAGAPTDLSMTVVGETITAHGPQLTFVPVALTDSAQDALVSAAEKLAAESAKVLPDLFPLAPRAVITQVRSTRTFLPAGRKPEAMLATIADTLNAKAYLEGAGRVVAVLSKDDFATLFGKSPAGAHVRSGRVLSQKLVAVSADANWDAVGHEIIHTLPELWAGDEMQKDCGRNFHNKEDHVAHGLQIDTGGVAGIRERRTGVLPLMGAGIPGAQTWISQCTYAQLVKELSNEPPDPPVYLVRGVVRKDGGKYKGELKSAYELWGHTDAKAKASNFFLVVRDDAKKEIARYPISLHWNDVETQTDRHAIAFAFRVPWTPEAALIELTGPGGVLDKKKVSNKPPEVEVKEPKKDATVSVVNGKVHVTWKAKNADSDSSYLYSVLYSANQGQSWTEQSFEQATTNFDIAIDPKVHSHQVKVKVTDGTRSSDAVVQFRLP